MQVDKKKAWDILYLIMTVIAIVLVQKYMTKQSVKDSMRIEREEHAKRLFGDAWREAL